MIELTEEAKEELNRNNRTRHKMTGPMTEDDWWKREARARGWLRVWWLRWRLRHEREVTQP